MTASLSLTVNGEPRRSSAANISALVQELELKPEKVAVERNDHAAPGMIESRHHLRCLTRIPSQAKSPHPRIGGG